MNKSILHFTILFTVLFLASYTFTHGAEAATLRFNLNQKDVAIGEVFPLDILLSADGQSLNAAEVKVSVEDSRLKIKDLSDGGSIINYWAEKPIIDENGSLIFQGVVLGGFNNKDGKLLTVYLEAIRPGKAMIVFDPVSSVYLDDGKGTEASLSLVSAAINVGSKVGQAANVAGGDVTPPETFEVQISKSKDVFDGAYFLAFAASDSESGMDYVAVKEGDFDWVIGIDSPYQLVNQKLDKNILIKAVDKSGNERVETLNLVQYQLIKKSIYILGLLAIALIIWQIIKRRRMKSQI